MTAAAPEGAEAQPSIAHSSVPVREGIFEWACGQLAKLSLIAMIVLIGGEVLMRNLLHYSWEGTDEFGSYLVVAAAFLSLATCQAYGGYHELQMVKMRLSRRGGALLNVVLNAVCLIGSIILLWQYTRLVMASWNNGDASTTSLRIPLWIPQLAMPLGIAALCLALIKTMLADLRVSLTPDTDHRV